jgi:hypothetical protein
VKKEMGVRHILPKSQVNQDATRVEAANTPIHANYVGGNND